MPSPSFARFQTRAVPRYTSYPTAPHFGPDVGPETVAGWLGHVSVAPISLYLISLYLHVPSCVQL